MKVGDLVREKTRMARKRWTGVILKVDYTQHTGDHMNPYQVRFFDGETIWTMERFLEVVSESR